MTAMKTFRLIVLLLGSFLVMDDGCAELIEARVTTTRDFGYVLGDVIHATLDVPMTLDEQLDAESLPKPGPLNRWLELRRLWHESVGEVRRIHFEYQLFYIPLAVKTLTIPPMTLRRKTSQGDQQPIEVPAWPVTVAPIHGLAVMAEGGMRLLQPEEPPARPDHQQYLRNAGLALILALAAFAYWAHLRGFLTLGRQGRHYRAAYRGLRKLMRSPPTSDNLRSGFLLLHRAFEQTLGKPLFAEDLPRFFEQHPDYQSLRGEIESCFKASYLLFFGSSLPSESFDLARLSALARACLRLERQRS
jgi:mxaA protein